MKNTLLFSLLFAATATNAQTYSFSHFFGGYTDLTTPISLNNGVTWDDPSYPVPIGFDFDLYGNTITQVEITDDGLGGHLYSEPCTPGELQSWIIPYTADIMDRGYNAGTSLSPISYQLEGTTGNQILKIEWKNVGFYSGLTDANDELIDYLNFQLWLYEGTNVIEMRYGPKSITEPMIDFEGETGSAAGLIQYDCDLDEIAVTGNNYWTSGNPSAPTLYNPIGDSIAFLDGMILPNMVYRFVPDPLNVEEIISDIDFSIAPNPATDQLIISVNDLTELKRIRITDLTGKQLFQSDFQAMIDVSSYASGYYILEVQSTNGIIARKKFLKQ